MVPMPRWMGRVNRRVFNPREIAKGERPVLSHVGRTSGRIYRTPLDAHPVEGGYVFVLVYGAGCDWVRNVLAAGSAQLTLGDEVIELVRPRVIDRTEADAALPASVARPPRLLRIDEFLRMDHAAA